MSLRTARDLVRRSAKVATKMAQNYAAGNMLSQVTITRPAPNTFDRSSAQMTDPAGTLVYSGPARFRSVSGETTYNLGGEPQYFAQSAVSIPISAARPWVNDNVHIDDCPDPSVIGRNFRVSGVDSGGQLPAVHLCQLVGAEPAPNVTQ